MTWLDGVTLNTVLVHVEGGPSMKGLISTIHDDCLVLKEVLVLHETDAAEQLAGLQIVPRERVLWVQDLS